MRLSHQGRFAVQTFQTNQAKPIFSKFGAKLFKLSKPFSLSTVQTLQTLQTLQTVQTFQTVQPFNRSTIQTKSIFSKFDAKRSFCRWRFCEGAICGSFLLVALMPGSVYSGPVGAKLGLSSKSANLIVHLTATDTRIYAVEERYILVRP